MKMCRAAFASRSHRYPHAVSGHTKVMLPPIFGCKRPHLPHGCVVNSSPTMQFRYLSKKRIHALYIFFLCLLPRAAPALRGSWGELGELGELDEGVQRARSPP